MDKSPETREELEKQVRDIFRQGLHWAECLDEMKWEEEYCINRECLDCHSQTIISLCESYFNRIPEQAELTEDEIEGIDLNSDEIKEVAELNRKHSNSKIEFNVRKFKILKTKVAHAASLKAKRYYEGLVKAESERIEKALIPLFGGIITSKDWQSLKTKDGE